MGEFSAYLLVITSTVLFSLQFIFQRRFNRSEGSDLYASLCFGFLSALVRILLVLLLYGTVHTFTAFAVCLSFFSAAGIFLNVFFSAKAFRYADMSLYSMFTMLGGMLLPFVTGIAFYGEPLTFWRGACVVLVVCALLLGTGKSAGGDKRAIKYYLGVFVTNGLSGVFAKINQASGAGVASSTYLMLGGMWSALICGTAVLIFMIRKKRRFLQKPLPALTSAALYGTLSAFGNLFLLLGLEVLPASVQYPLVTGGTMVLSTAIAFFMHEKVTLRRVIAVLVALAAVTLLCI